MEAQRNNWVSSIMGVAPAAQDRFELKLRLCWPREKASSIIDGT
jgi:hypothetical protein